MKTLGALLCSLVLLTAATVTPASWWFNRDFLDRESFQAAMLTALERTDTDGLLEGAEPAIADLAVEALGSEEGQRLILQTSLQSQAAFVAWLDRDSSSPAEPGARVRLDLDQLLADQTDDLAGIVGLPPDAVELGSVDFGVPMPPDWMRGPMLLLREALVPGVIACLLAAAGIVALTGGRLKVLAWVLAAAAALCLTGSLLAWLGWGVLGADGSTWSPVAILSALVVQPLITAYLVAGLALSALAAGSAVADRGLAGRGSPS